MHAKYFGTIHQSQGRQRGPVFHPRDCYRGRIHLLKQTAIGMEKKEICTCYASSRVCKPQLFDNICNKGHQENAVETHVGDKSINFLSLIGGINNELNIHT